MFEWYNMFKHRNRIVIYNAIGIIYCLIVPISFYLIRDLNNGFSILIWHIVSICIVDTSAYIFGSLIQGPKLLPSVSPKKTWSGSLCAVLLSIVFNLEFNRVFNSLSYDEAALWGFAVAVLSILSDLIESYIKRINGVKDSGNIIPGHGGLLDRIDGYLLSSPALLLLYHWKLWC